MLALECRNLVKRYRAGIRGCSAGVDALRGADLRAWPGEVVGVVGAPGAGKSTLLLCACGAIRPDSGTVTWFGRPAGRGAHTTAVAYVPDAPMHYPFLSVREVLEHHARLRALPPDECRRRVDAALRCTDLEQWQGVRMAMLPPGIARRLAIAEACLAEPRLLVVDEPFARGPGMASHSAIGDMLRSIAAEGASVVVASRDARALARTSTRMVVFSVGRVHEELDPTRLQLADRVAEARR